MSARTRGSGLIRRPPRAIPVGLLAAALLVAGGLGSWLLGTYLVHGTWPGPASPTVSGVAETGRGAPG
ncbi:MAG: alkaline shock response membrane anchor protein AmaP, partial [Dietzia cercidiphylli]